MFTNKQDPIASLITLITFGLIAAYFAKKQGKKPVIWFMLGFLFALPALCFLLFLPIKQYFEKKKTPLKKEETPPPPIFAAETIWYYLDQNNCQQGPVSFQLLQKMQKENLIQTNTYIWNESFTDWKKWEELF